MKTMLRLAVFLMILMAEIDDSRAASFQILDVFSGDTLNVEIRGDAHKIRLYGIDAPVSGQHGNVAATRFLKRLLRDQAVSIELLHADSFGQTLAIVVREGKESSVNAAMVANGYAWVNPRRCSTDICSQWKQLEMSARDLRLGIWLGFDLEPPWEFNRRQGD